ncbi:MAG: T9SS C-terminal target domain-containing protein [Bacteroidetes bacterium]|nr:MAG: T9SS C-terminal target domain-containing protein [Bacteroidota bacterium]
MVTTAGANAVNGAQLVWSLGEPVAEFYYSNTHHLTQGFQQGALNGPVLPLDLVHFFAQRTTPESVQISWETQSETGIAYFEIQRQSPSDARFSDRLRETPRGTPVSGARYTVSDPNAFSETTLYRLKIVEWSGDSIFSIIRPVEGVGAAFAFSIFPNPSDGNFRLAFPTTRAGIEWLHIRIFDAIGTLRLEQTLPYNPSDTSLSLPADCPDGIYRIHVQTNLSSFDVQTLTKTR